MIAGAEEKGQFPTFGQIGALAGKEIKKRFVLQLC